MAAKKKKPKIQSKVVRKKTTPKVAAEKATQPAQPIEAQRAATEAHWNSDAGQARVQAVEAESQPLPKPVGRRSIFNSPHLKDLAEAMTEEMCDYIRKGDFTSTAATRVGVPIRTMYSWMSKGDRELEGGQEDGPHVQFMQAIRQAEAERQSMLVGCIADAAQFKDYSAGKNGDPKHWGAAAWLLERQDPATFGVRIKHHVEVELGQALDRLQKALTPDEYEKALAAIVSDDGGASPGPTAPAEAEDESDASAMGADDKSEIPTADASEAPDRPYPEGD